eukprot:scaffold4635_cov267-Pinguiococcus_pyrenoidosus.AAC.6
MRVLPALMLVWSASACDKFCDFEDCGSCGNACCKLSYYVNGLSTEEVVKMLNKTLGAGGPDGHYAQVMVPRFQAWCASERMWTKRHSIASRRRTKELWASRISDHLTSPCTSLDKYGFWF